MTNKFHLSSIALLIGGIALSGCAAKRTYSPELEDARETFRQVSTDPLVSSLASAELQVAEKQLQVAQDAADYFKGNEVISHEAAIAKLKTLEAQQTARGLAAKDNLKLARAATAQSPTLAAALPAPPQTNTAPTATYADSHTPIYSSDVQHSGSMQGGNSDAGSALSETQKLAQQLASISAQIIELQKKIEGGAKSTQSQAVALQTFPQQYTEQPFTEKVKSLSPQHEVAQPPSNYTAFTADPAVDHTAMSADEPVIAAAIAAPTDTAFVPAKEVISDARLREELRAMNARPSSRGMSLTLGERYFEAESARLWNGRAGRHLDNIAAVMVENKGLDLDVEAHTDDSGTAESRNNLTQDRAIAIKSALVLRGVDAARINTAGFGAEVPLASNDTQLGRLQNRRVEIIFPDLDI